jgi:GNAT superfamily N-acetyltransferase
MIELAQPDKDCTLISAADVRPIGIDDLSTVRYIHAAALRTPAASRLSETEIAAFAAYVYSDAYTGLLVEAARAKRLLGATVGEDLVGTAGWSPADDRGAVARLICVFVLPLFAGCGLGRLLALAAEDQARRAGFRCFTVRATLNASGFFTQLGYEVSSRGVWALGPGQSLPVTFLRKRLPGAPPLPAGSRRG